MIASVVGCRGVQLVNRGAGVGDGQFRRHADAVLLVQPLVDIELEPVADGLQRPEPGWPSLCGRWSGGRWLLPLLGPVLLWPLV